MGDVLNLDPGVRFVPTDEEVVMQYLVKAAMGEALPGNYVIERDLYANKAPWEILMTATNNHEEGQGQGGVGDVVHHLPWINIRSRDENSGRIKKESTIYVLTALKKASHSGNRIGRRAGCGGWHGRMETRSWRWKLAALLDTRGCSRGVYFERHRDGFDDPKPVDHARVYS